MKCLMCNEREAESVPGASGKEFCFLCYAKAINVKLAEKEHPKICAKFLLNIFLPFLKKKGVELKDSKMSVKTLGKAIWLLSLGRITHNELKTNLEELYESGKDPVEYFNVTKDFTTTT